ncbi:MAG: hypothetical protein ACI89L_001086 [Phycisphaerales bacterium]|jgi:hypothetical protein
MTRTITSIAILAAAASFASAQPTVDFSSPAWQDFGTTDVIFVSGNFLPGWTTINASPDLGDDLFFNPNESFSGVDDDAALWMNHWDPGSFNYASQNEVVELSLSGFTIGDEYTIGFGATILWHGTWNVNSDTMEAALTGASISNWTSTLLTDPVEFDGLNTWVPQSMVFTATATTVSVRFGEGAFGASPNDVARFGIDEFRVKPVPSPATLTLALIGAGLLGRRRR